MHAHLCDGTLGLTIRMESLKCMLDVEPFIEVVRNLYRNPFALPRYQRIAEKIATRHKDHLVQRATSQALCSILDKDQG